MQSHDNLLKGIMTTCDAMIFGLSSVTQSYLHVTTSSQEELDFCQPPVMAVNCTLFPDKPSYCDAIVAVKRTVASLSMIGSFFIIFIIWLFQKYKHFEQRLLLALSAAAFMSCISYLMGDLHPEKGPMCVLQAWWLTYFNRCVILLVCCITFNLYWNTVKEKKSIQFEKWYHVISWCIPLPISLLPLIDDHYGPAGPWCWIPRNSSNSTVWRFMMWYVPLFIIITILFLVYGYIVYTIRKKEREWAGLYNDEVQQSRELFTKEVKPLMAYPCIYLATSIFPLIHRIYNTTTAIPSFPLLLLHVIFNPLAGALNAIAYSIDKETMKKLKWQHIKAAFLYHFRSTPIISEYQIEPTAIVNKALDDDIVDYTPNRDDVENKVGNQVNNFEAKNYDNEASNDVDNDELNDDVINKASNDVDNEVNDDVTDKASNDVDNEVNDVTNKASNGVDNEVNDNVTNEVSE